MRLRVLVVAALVALVAVPAALADGDPASDFLLSQASFLSPYDGKISTSQQKRIEAMLQSAKEQGFPLKLAVIATRYDLGAVPILYRKPQTYAKFLAQEDYYFWKDELLVVMPNGYGLYKLKNLPPGTRPRSRSSRSSTPRTARPSATPPSAQSRRSQLGAGSRWRQEAGPGEARSGSSAREIAGGAVVICLLAAGGVFVWRRRGRAEVTR